MSERRIIPKEEFFYVVQDNYDEHIETAIPYYLEMHREMAAAAADAAERPRRILDLGIGTGKTAAMLLDRFPHATVVGIDLFDEMLGHARNRLAVYEGRVDLIQGDFAEVPLGSGFDLCVSSLAIHHQTNEGKQQLFRRIAAALQPGGRFMMIDWTKFRSPTLQNLSAKSAERNAALKVAQAAIVKQWIDHWRHKNIPDVAEDLCRWLIDAGFRHAEIVIRYYGMALIIAEKSP